MGKTNKPGFGHLVYEHASVDYRTVLRFMKAADILYLPSGRDVKYALPFKFFDYLSVRRPILAVTPSDSAVAMFVSDLDCGEVVEPDRVTKIADALERILARSQKYSYCGSEQYNWTSIASRYSQLMNGLVAGKA